MCVYKYSATAQHCSRRLDFLCREIGFYFTANEVKEADKQSICGAATYKLIKNLLAPAKPADTFQGHF